MGVQSERRTDRCSTKNYSSEPQKKKKKKKNKKNSEKI